MQISNSKIAKLTGQDYFNSLWKMATIPREMAEMLSEYVSNGIWSFENTEILRKMKDDTDKLYDDIIALFKKNSTDPEPASRLRNPLMSLKYQVNYICEISVSFYYLNITKIREDVYDNINLLIDGCEIIRNFTENMKNGQEENQRMNIIINAQCLLPEMELSYTGAMRKLFSSNSNHLEIIKWNEVYSRMKSCFEAYRYTVGAMDFFVPEDN